MSKLLVIILVALGCASPSVTRAQTPSPSPPEDDNKPQILKTSPSGAVRVVENGEDYWIVSGADEKARSKMYSAELAGPEEFRFSPDEKWLYVELHRGSCMSGADLYRRDNSGLFQRVQPPLGAGAWTDAVKQHLYKENFEEEGSCAMVRFGSWSDDSGRLLLIIRGGEERRETVARYLYYNTRTGKFELTAYLRKVNAASGKSHEFDLLACAEPVDPLPDEPALKKHYAAVDKKLNEDYRRTLATAEKDAVSNVKQSQREWLKSRNGGLQIYLATTPPAEKERRRLQFLTDVSRDAIEDAEDEATRQ